MTIKNKVTDGNCTQWIEGLVKSIIGKAGIVCESITIEDWDNKRIYLSVDGEDMDIRTWSYEPVDYDFCGRVCAENVHCTLFRYVSDGKGSGHGEEVYTGDESIRWDNDIVMRSERNIMEEKAFADFVSRKEFMDRTGIYTSPDFYEVVYERFKESNMPVEEFVDNYAQSCGGIEEITIGESFKFKYDIADDMISEQIDIIGADCSIYDVLDAFVSLYLGKWAECDALYSTLEDIQNLSLMKEKPNSIS